MSSYHDLVSALTYLLVHKLQSQSEYTRGLLGNGQGAVQVPGRPDYTYVRPDRFTTRVFEVFNKMVSGPDGMPVILGELPWSPGLTQVLSVDWDTYLGVGWGDATPGIARHGQTHEHRDAAPGVDTFNVYRRQMGDLKLYPVGSGSMSIYVSSYNLTHMEEVKSWPGLPGMSLSGAVPSATGTARMALVYWDPCSGTTGWLGVATGTLGVDAETEILNRPAAPAGTIPVAYARLAGGQGTLTEFDVWDARPLWQPSLEFSTGSCGIWAGLIPIGDPGLHFTGSTVEAALDELASAGGGAPSGPAGGDLTGTYPNPNVAAIWSYPLQSGVPSAGDIWMFSGTSWQHIPGAGALVPAVHDHSNIANGGQNLHDLAEVEFNAAAELTLDGADTVTRTQVYHIIAQANPLDPSDILETINGGTEGDLLIIRAKAGDLIYVVATGNIHLMGGGRRILDDAGDHLMLVSNDVGQWADVGGSLGVHDHSSDDFGGNTLYNLDHVNILGNTGGLSRTISGGAITYNHGWLEVDTEAGAGSDELDTITAGTAVQGQLLFLQPADGTHTVVVKHNTGNIWVPSGTDVTLDDIDDCVLLFYDGSKWVVIGVFSLPTGVDPAGHTHSKLVASDGAPDPALSADASGNVTGVGWEASDAHAFKVKNTSGGAAAANDVGYIDENGEYKTTTTAYSNVAWCVVVSGGANNADIYVARRGRVTVALNGNCSAGDYLYTSTTAGQAQPQAYVRPELFAVALTANAGGAGGTCSALLLCHTQFISTSSATDILYVASQASSDFRATINGAPVGAAVVYNAPTSGAENTIDPQSATGYGKIRLYNETRGDYALIDDVNTGTNTITLTDNAPAAWANTDVITTRSQTVVYPAPPPYFYDVDLSSADNTLIPETARALVVDAWILETGGGGYSLWTHPWEAYAGPKVKLVVTQVANVSMYRSITIPLLQRRFAYMVVASGAATASIAFRVEGWLLAVP